MTKSTNLLQKLKSKFQLRWAQGCSELLIFRLKLDRLLHPQKLRVLATACWTFPIYSQTFVYQELTQLVRNGFLLRFFYSEFTSRDQIPDQFTAVWRSRRKMHLHPLLCKRDYRYFKKRMPEKVNQLISLICKHANLSDKELLQHHHFQEAFGFARLVEAYQPNYLHSYFFYEGTLFSFVASFLLNIPRGVSCYADHMLKDYELKMAPLHLRNCRIVVATSEHIKKELLSIAPEMNPSAIVVKPNAINIDRFHITTEKDPAPGNPLRIVSVGRIDPKKGFLYMMNAMRMLEDKGITAHWHILGDADPTPVSQDHLKLLQERVKELKLHTTVHFEGRRSESEILKWLARADVFVAPSVELPTGDKDGIPTALLEAMAAGVPVVSTTSGSIPEVIDSGKDGLLVPQMDASALANAIESLLSDKTERLCLSIRAREKVSQKFDSSRCDKLLADRIQRLTRAQFVLTNTPLVSVIMIFYNAEKFMKEAIESVLHQSYSNWELILVDDGSTDSSTDLAIAYRDRFPEKVRYVEHEGHINKGMSATRNLGIRHARGRYIAFIDSDDFWYPNKLEGQVSIMESHPEASMIYGATQYWQSWNGKVEESDYIPDLGIEPDRVYLPGELSTLLYPLSSGASPCPSDILVKADAIADVGGFEEHFQGIYQMYEDMGFLSKIYLRHAVYVSGECWDRYRLSPDACHISVIREGKYDVVRKYFLNWFHDYLNTNGVNDHKILTAVEQARTENSKQEVSPTENHQIRLDSLPWGTSRRLTPLSRYWGLDRGQPIDRYYIENFLSRHSEDIRGRTLEVEDDTYTAKFGGNRTIHRDVLHVNADNPKATIIADLTNAPQIASDTYDCIVLTQTLQLIYDTRAALNTLHRILKPGGVLLATFPGISQISQDVWRDQWSWAFTTASARRLFGEFFDPQNFVVRAWGNVLVASAFLYGCVAEEMTTDELDFVDPDYELLITVRAWKGDFSMRSTETR